MDEPKSFCKIKSKRDLPKLTNMDNNYESDSDGDAQNIDNAITTDGEVFNPPYYEGEATETKDTPNEEKLILYPNTLWINTRPLSKYATTYEMEKFEKNCLIIFNQENVIGYEPRLGTDNDVRVLSDTFSKFGFEIEEHKDLTKRELFRVLDSFNYRNFSEYGCVAVVVLTHGTIDGRLRAKDQQYTEFDIIDAFKTNDKPSLITKPKLLIIQACRGNKSVKGVAVGYSSTAIRKDEIYDFEPYTLPVEADMFVLHSSYMGNPSHRHEVNGTWLIQTLCRKIMELAPTHDLEYIATEVKREVAIDRYHEEYNTSTLEFETNKQIPVVTSTLIRKLYLRRYGYENPVSCLDNLEPCKSQVQLDSATPLLVEFGPCLCFLDYFAYIRKCLRLYIEHNPDDSTAQSFFDVSEAFEDGFEFNTAKEKMSKAIVDHLLIHAEGFEFYKYIYFKNSNTDTRKCLSGGSFGI